MPTLGLGTWQNTDPEQCAESVRTALEVGYRHVDTAQMYDNERAVGEGIARAAVDREDVFLATKVHPDDLAHDDVLSSTRESLDGLGVDRVDLLYVHWPAGPYDAEATLSAFERLHDEGLIDRVGVSNFTPDLLAEAVEACDVPIAADQVELHPLLPRDEVLEVCEAHDVEAVAYSPLARGAVFDVPEIQAVAERRGVSEAQVSLAWVREKGAIAIPKATGRDHVVDNWRSLSVDLDGDDVDRIDAIDARRRLVDPGFAPWN